MSVSLFSNMPGLIILDMVHKLYYIYICKFLMVKLLLLID